MVLHLCFLFAARGQKPVRRVLAQACQIISPWAFEKKLHQQQPNMTPWVKPELFLQKCMFSAKDMIVESVAYFFFVIQPEIINRWDMDSEITGSCSFLLKMRSRKTHLPPVQEPSGPAIVPTTHLWGNLFSVFFAECACSDKKNKNKKRLGCSEPSKSTPKALAMTSQSDSEGSQL